MFPGVEVTLFFHDNSGIYLKCTYNLFLFNHIRFSFVSLYIDINRGSYLKYNMIFDVRKLSAIHLPDSDMVTKRPGGHHFTVWEV